jgi:hypothetical protein
MRKLKIARCGLFAIALWTFTGWASARASSCLPFMPKGPAAGSFVSLSATTMNADHVVSYSTGVATPVLSADGKTEAWQTLTGQYFSDRYTGSQPFLNTKVDEIQIVVSIAASPKVTVTLKNWGDAQSSFTGTCTADGVMHGTTSTVEYLIGLKSIAGTP